MSQPAPETRIDRATPDCAAELLALQRQCFGEEAEFYGEPDIAPLTQTLDGLLADFREVEQNFRTLDRAVRERIALWEGGKGTLLEEIFGERDVIADSDQGRSFRAFWDFLMSPARQEELTELLAAGQCGEQKKYPRGESHD